MSLLLSSAGICASNTGGGGGSPTATYLELDDTPANTVGWTPASVTKTGMDLTNTTSRNHIAWDMSGFTAFADGANIVFNAFQPVSSANTHYLRLSADNTLSTDNVSLWSGVISSIAGNHTTVEATISAANISGRDFLGFINTLTSGDLQIRNFTMGGNATEALDLTKPISKNIGFTVSGASATGITLTGTTSRNTATWALPHYTGYADGETITFDIDSPGRVLVRVGRGDDLNTTGGDTLDTIYDGTPGGTPVPITVTLTSTMISNHRRFFGILNLDTSAVTITNFTTSSTSAPSDEYSVTYTGALSGISAEVTAEGADWRVTVTDSGVGTYDGDSAVFTDAEINSSLPNIVTQPVDDVVGSTHTITPGLSFATSEVEVVKRWYRNGDLFLSGESEYTITAPQDDYAQIEYIETHSTTSGSVDTTAVVVQAGYQEAKVVFDGSTGQRSYMSTIISGVPTTSNITEALVFASYDVNEVTAQGSWVNGTGFTLFTNGYGTPASLKMGSGTAAFTNTSGRIHVLGTLSGGTLKAIMRPANANASATRSADISSTGGIFDHTTGATGFGTNGTFSSFITGKLVQFSVWDLRTTSVPDLDDSAVQALFWNPATFKMKPPSVAQASLGDKASGRYIVGIYGDVTLANNGADFLNTPTNYGLYADYSCGLNGTFTAEAV